jgi:hypothetical protein
MIQIMSVISYEVKVKMMTMTIFQKHRASTVAKPSYAVQDDSENGTGVFRYQNQ